MINLLPDRMKKDIRVAHTNTILLNYSIAILFLGVLVAIVFGTGFWLLHNEKNAVENGLASQNAKIAQYKPVSDKANKFRNDLQIAKAILGNEVSYSQLLTTFGSDMPAGAIIEDFSISSANLSNRNEPIPIRARTNSYSAALSLKDSLEKSILFEDVKIESIQRPEDVSETTGTQANYPFSVTLSTKVSAFESDSLGGAN